MLGDDERLLALFCRYFNIPLKVEIIWIYRGVNLNPGPTLNIIGAHPFIVVIIYCIVVVLYFGCENWRLFLRHRF